MKAEDIERIFKETVSRPENNIHLLFEKHARVGRKYNGEYIYSDKLICEYTPEQVLQQLQEIADEKKVDITESDVLIEQGRRYGGYDDEIFVKIIHPPLFPQRALLCRMELYAWRTCSKTHKRRRFPFQSGSIYPKSYRERSGCEGTYFYACRVQQKDGECHCFVSQ